MISLGRPFHVLPKTTTLDILVQNKRVAFLDPLFFKRRQGFSNERPRNTLSSVFSLNNEMTQNASPALMATHHSGDDAVIRTGDEAEPLIPLQVDSDRPSTIALIEINTFSLCPKATDFIVIRDCHFADDVIHVIDTEVQRKIENLPFDYRDAAPSDDVTPTKKRRRKHLRLV